jgi:hypothetical protein
LCLKHLPNCPFYPILCCGEKNCHKHGSEKFWMRPSLILGWLANTKGGTEYIFRNDTLNLYKKSTLYLYKKSTLYIKQKWHFYFH